MVSPATAAGFGQEIPVKIEHLALREIRMRLKAPFETSFGITHDRRIVLVEIIADGVSGW